MPVSLSIEVYKKQIAVIKRFPSNIRAEIRMGMVKISKMLQKEARDRAPKDTGHLAYGGKKKARYGPGGIFGSASITEMAIYLKAKAVYAAIVEFGGISRTYRAQPYLRPTINENMKDVRTTIINSMSEAWGK